jgi:AAA+ superfamily predicted ATPase
MWVKVEGKRRSEGQKFVVRCASETAGQKVTEERSVIGAAAARRAGEMLAASLNVTATVYGADEQGEFVYGVCEASDGAGEASSPVIKRLFAESAAASLSLKDQLIADIPEDSIRGFASLAASLGYIASQHKQAKRSGAPRINYATLFRIFCGDEEPGMLSLAANDATLALLSRRLCELPGWLWLSELEGLGVADQQAINPRVTPGKVTLDLDGDLQVLQPRTVFRGVAPGGGRFMLILQGSRRVEPPHGVVLDSVGLVYREADEAEVVALTRRLLQEADPFKNRVVLVNRGLWTVRSRISDRSWNDVIPNARAKEELDFIAASIRNREMLKAEGLSIKRGLLLSGPPGDGKSTAIECFANDIAGEATIIIVEVVDRIRAIYQLAQTLAPAVVILEDLDLITRSRQNPNGMTVKDDLTGELLQVLSGASAYPDVVTIATTNYFEAIDVALSRRAGRFDAHVRMGYPTDDEKQRVLELYLDRFSVADKLTRRRLQMVLAREFSQLQLVPAHIEEFVKSGVKRARLARRAPEYSDFEPGIEATKSIAVPKPAPQIGGALAEALALLQKLDQEERPTAAQANRPDMARPTLSQMS